MFLLIQNTNWISSAARANIGDENKMILKYSTVDGSRVVLTGINEDKNNIYVVLDRIDRKYILPQSTLEAGKY